MFEVCSAKVGPRYFVFHQHFSKGARHHLRGSLHSDLNVECVVTAIQRPPNNSHSENRDADPSLRLRNYVDVRCACLDCQPLLDEYRTPTNTPGWNRGSHFPPLAGLSGMHKIFSPNAGIGVLSFRPCRLCSGVFPSLPMSHLFIKYPCVGDSGPDATRSLWCSGLAGHESHCTLDDPTGLAFPHW